ncbi:MAG: hypothetical protein MR419_10740 [Clostridiales bacterium]|nr:hypothetical protein [Clostridiales bacterium]MDY4171600.1 hypothetical protein [Evtepia sp.]
MTANANGGAAAYDGTAALKMAAPEAPAKKKPFQRKRRKDSGGQETASKAKGPDAGRKGPAAGLLARSGRMTVPGAIGAILVLAMVVVITLASYAQLVVVNDKAVELRNELSQLKTEETKLLAQYELAYDLQEIERQMLTSGEMMQVQSWQTYTLELSEPDEVEYHQASDLPGRIMAFAKDLVSAVKEYF